MTPPLNNAFPQRKKALQNPHDAKPNKRSPGSLARLVLLILFIVAMGAFIAMPGSSSALVKKSSLGRLSKAGRVQTNAPSLPAPVSLKTAGLGFEPLAPFMPQASSADTVETYDGTCTNLKNSFNLGDTVCAKVTGPLASDRVLRHIQLVSPDGFVIDSADLTGNPQTVTFTLPTIATFPLYGLALDNRGTWRINMNDTADASVRALALFTVHDPAQVVADLQISKSVIGSAQSTAGSDVQSVIWVFNGGPDAAQNVHFTDVPPANTTFQGLTQTAGPTFTCTPPAVDSTGTTTCTKSSMAKDEAAGFIITYKVSGSIANGSELDSSVTVASDTAERSPDNNSSDTTSTASNPTPGTCTLTCPGNISAVADTVEDVGGVPTSGAHVTFSSAETAGDCGTVTASTPSGSFFAVGSTPVTINSSQGGSCSFLVIVTSSGSPVSIACPADINVNAGSDCQATVTLGTPTTTGDNVTVTSSRGDGKPMTAPFSSGVTVVTWTATNSSGTESCSQKVTVNDITPPTITIATPAPASADANCQAAIPDLTQVAQVLDNCACDSSDSAESCAGRVSVAVIQDPAPGTLVGLGSHTITLTANDGSSNNNGAGNTTTATVIFTVNDTTAPAFTFVPPGVTAYTGAGATSCDTVISNATLGTATASDNCQVATVTRSPSGNTFPVGTTTVTWTATDGSGNTATATQAVTVIDNTVPTISLNGANPITVECHTSFSDPGVTASDNCDQQVDVTTAGSVIVNTPGTYTLTYTATDDAGNHASVSRTVNVVDTIPPTINLNGQNISFWPPNHSYKTVNVTDLVASVTDSCDTTIAVSNVVISKVTSDETENGNGDGNTLNDIIIAANCKSVQLRAERDGGGDGRVYTITFRVKDASNNTTTATAKVTVPKSQGNGAAVDSGPHYTVNGNCP
ncbi:MAG: hypothetical protein QOJ02_1051 [Acidobacteriota bacterium]|jgi:uncharacterized repeat protein (TIGR01451 family)|nr:hypothetical protein [Acidobacteriota bacterium]